MCSTEALDRRALVGEARGKRVMRRLEADRQFEGLAQRPALRLVERPRRLPLDLVENAELAQNMVLHVARVARVGGLMKGGLDPEIADLVDGSRAAKAEITFEQTDAVSRVGQKRARREAAEPRADHRYVIFPVRHAPRFRDVKPCRFIQNPSALAKFRFRTIFG